MRFNKFGFNDLLLGFKWDLSGLNRIYVGYEWGISWNIKGALRDPLEYKSYLRDVDGI